MLVTKVKIQLTGNTSPSVLFVSKEQRQRNHFGTEQNQVNVSL